MLEFIAPLEGSKIIEEYQIINCLGQGGFGTTYFCYDQHLKRNCVIKEYTPHKIAYRNNQGNLVINDGLMQELYYDGLIDFFQEAQRLALFNHPNIVRINRFLKQNNTGYFVMDYEEGDSLRNILRKRTQRFEEIEIEKIIVPLCEGLNQLHKTGLIHRDIKPDNIIIRSNGTPVLIDFGAIGNLNSLSYNDYKIYCTPHYAPVEQYSSKFPQGAWLDIYAIAATVYELIAGYPPKNSIERIISDDLIPILHIGRGMYGTKLLTLIDKCLSLDYKGRPQSITELLDLFNNNKYLAFKNMVDSITLKAIAHFMNFTTPNQGLKTDEFVSFLIGFSVIDLTWRLGKGGLMDNELFDFLIDEDRLSKYLFQFKEKGYYYQNRILTKDVVKSRLEEYAASYLLDRQEDNWEYKLTLKQCAKNCLTKDFESDKEGFIDLLEGVIDRYRGRIKKELEKKYYDMQI